MHPVLGSQEQEPSNRRDRTPSRGVIETAFEFLDHIAALVPVRAIDLAAATGAAVSLSATLDDNAVILETVDGRTPLTFLPDLGAKVPSGTA